MTFTTFFYKKDCPERQSYFVFKKLYNKSYFEAGRRPRKRSLHSVNEHFEVKPDAKRTLLDNFLKVVNSHIRHRSQRSTYERTKGGYPAIAPAAVALTLDGKNSVCNTGTEVTRGVQGITRCTTE